MIGMNYEYKTSLSYEFKKDQGNVIWITDNFLKIFKFMWMKFIFKIIWKCF